ncbi:MAG: glycosyltransferase [Bacteroidia bacterium]|nr:glycosyltransferase [Bacteroidia bacterium]
MQKVIIIGSAYPYRGGLATFKEQLARVLQTEDREVEIFTFILQYPSILFPGKTQLSDEPAPSDLKITRAVNSINPLNWIIVGNKIKKLKPDLVIFKFWIPFISLCFGTIARIIKKNKHTKVIAITDNVIPHEKRPFDNQLIQYFVNSCDGFISMSDTVLKDLEQFNTSKPMFLTPHPLYSNFGEIIPKQSAKERLNLDPNFNYLLFFGFIRAYKGLDLLLKAFANEKLRNLQLKLIVAGEYYENPEPYQKIIAENNLQDHIILKDEFVPNSDVQKYFCAADIIVQPYKSATQSGVTQIAYHFNKPMIVTNVGGLPEMVPNEKVGYVVNQDPEEIAEAIYKFYNEKKEDFFVSGVMEEKKKYGWDIFVHKIEELYKTI